MTEFKKTICPYDCPAFCGLLAETDGKKIYSVKGDPDHPLFHGLICNKMQHYERAINSPHRLLTPLKRCGRKGAGAFVPVSWDQAVTEITDKWKQILAEDGPDAFLGLSSSGTQAIIQKNIVDGFFHKIGGRRMTMTLCDGARAGALASTVGGGGNFCMSELTGSDYFIVWGCNLKNTRIHALSMLQAYRKKGAKAVLVEVCGLDNAAYCDETLLVRPGSDGALALAMMHVLAEEGMTDDAYMREFAVGYEEFKATLPAYTPEWAAEKTGLPAETIVKLAREFGRAKAPSIIAGAGLTRRGNGGMNGRLIVILSAITGAWKSGGGLVFGNPKDGSGVDKSLIFRPDLRTHHGLGANINLLSQALSAEQEVPVKAFYLSGGNPVNAVHDQKNMIRSLEREDLFTVVHEQHMTDTARYADYVLPAAFSTEYSDCYSAFGYSTFGVAYKISEAPGEAKSNWDTICLLARAMGFPEEHWKMTAEEMLELLLSHPQEPLCRVSAEEMEELKKGGTIMVPYKDHSRTAHPDGRLHIIDEKDPHPMPCYQEDFPSPYPLNLVSIPGFYSLNTVFAIRDDLMEKRGPMQLILHTEDAAARNIKNGDQVIAFNDMAEVPYEALVTDQIARGCAAVSGVYGTKDSGQALQTNALHRARLSDIGNGTSMNGNFIDVRKENT